MCKTGASLGGTLPREDPRLDGSKSEKQSRSWLLFFLYFLYFLNILDFLSFF